MSTRSLSELVRRPRRSRLIGVAVVSLLAGALVWYLGLDILRSVAVTVVVAAVGVAWVALPDHMPLGWPEPPLRAADGARHDVVELSWSLRTRGGGVRDAAVQRIRGLARTRLATRQLDVDNPRDQTAIEALIGADAYRTIRGGSATSKKAPSLRAVVRCLDALDRLDGGALVAERAQTADENVRQNTDRTMKEQRHER